MRTYTTAGKKVVQRREHTCAECKHDMVFVKSMMYPWHWECTNKACPTQELMEEAYRDFWGDEPDWTQG